MSTRPVNTPGEGILGLEGETPGPSGRLREANGFNDIYNISDVESDDYSVSDEEVDSEVDPSEYCPLEDLKHFVVNNLDFLKLSLTEKFAIPPDWKTIDRIGSKLRIFVDDLGELHPDIFSDFRWNEHGERMIRFRFDSSVVLSDADINAKAMKFGKEVDAFATIPQSLTKMAKVDPLPGRGSTGSKSWLKLTTNENYGLESKL